MLDWLISVRNYIMRIKYKWVLRPIFFKIDAETIHNEAIGVGKFLGKYALFRKIAGSFWNYRNPALEQNILGINFKNPVGLAAGFDKNANLIEILPSVGFGFME